MYSGRYTTEAEQLLAILIPTSHINTISAARDTFVLSRMKYYYEHFKLMIEEKYSEQSREKPFSTSEILTLLLEINSGSIAKAIDDLAQFYKFASREMLSLHDEDLEEDERAVWMQKYITDEYSTVNPYTDMSIKTHADDLLNRVGLPYHFAYATDLLSKFPAEAVVMFVAGEYFLFFNGHGATKALADMFFLKDLNEIEKMLEKHSQKTSV